MRLFLAIDLPDLCKQQLSKQLYSLEKEYPSFNWVDIQNYHMTVQFFGETQKKQDIIKKTNDILYDQQSFYLYATGLDLFMDGHITIYVRFRREHILDNLIKKVQNTFGQEFNSLKKFVPHVTVSRCRIPSKQQYFHLQKKIKKVDIDLDFKVTQLTLFESNMHFKKPVYTMVKTFLFLDNSQ
ncbi:MAG: RNA 2',3'-cyclic phosphodiesterase [Patescibacteria group bacterium]